MKKSLLSFSAIALLAAIGAFYVWRAPRAAAEPAKSSAGAGEAIHLKAGRGLGFHPRLRANIKLVTAEVAEVAVAPAIRIHMHVSSGALADGVRRVAQDAATSLASGWVSAGEAAKLAPGQEVELRSGPAGGAPARGRILRLEKSAYAVLGDFEVTVETPGAFEAGTKLEALCRLPAGEATPAVPRSAVLQTAEGSFVYAVNDGFYLRTAIKIGSANEQSVEIAEGLYAGDEIVVSPVQTLWMAELQLLRGGKACTCGH